MADTAPSVGLVEAAGVAVGAGIGSALAAWRAARGRGKSDEGLRSKLAEVSRDLQEHLEKAEPLMAKFMHIEATVEEMRVERQRDRAEAQAARTADRNEILTAIRDIGARMDTLGHRLDAMLVPRHNGGGK